MTVALSVPLPSPCRPAKHTRHHTATVPASRARHTVSQSAYMRALCKARPSSLSHMPTARTGCHARPLKAARVSRRTLPTDTRSDRGRAGQRLRTARCSPSLRARPPAAPSQLDRSRIRTHEGQRKGSARHSARSATPGPLSDTSPRAWAARDQYTFARALVQGGRTPRATTLTSSLAIHDPAVVTLLLSRGCGCSRQGRARARARHGV